MDLKGIMLTAVSQTEKDKQCMISLICEILKMQQASKYNQKGGLTDLENKLMVTSGWGGQYRGEEMEDINY